MTGVDVPPLDLKGILDKRSREALNRGYIPLETFTPDRQEPWYARAAYYAYKYSGGELSARVAGQLLNLGPKYDFSTPTHGLYDQLSFTSVFKDLGVDNPLAAAIMGVAADVANPFDLINKFKVGHLTAKGIVGEQIPGLFEKGLIAVNKAGRATLSAADLEADVARLSKVISQGKKAPSFDIAAKELPKAERALAQRKELSKVLGKLQDKGTTFEDLQNMPAKAFEQARLGQRRLLGLTSPFALDQLSFLSRTPAFTKLREKFWPTIGLFDNAPVISLPTKLDAAIWKGLDSTIGEGGRFIANKFRDYLGAITYPTLTTVKQREVAAEMEKVRNELYGIELPMAVSRTLDVIKKAKQKGLSLEAAKDVARALEDRTGLQSITDAESKFFTKVIEDNWEKIDYVPTEVTKQNIDEAINAVRASRLDPKGRLLINLSNLTTEDLPKAVDSFKASQTPKTYVGNYPSYLDDNYLVIGGKSKKTFNTFDPKELADIYGVPQFVKHTTEDSSFLVARRRPESARMISPQNPHKGGIPFEPVHAQNLELVAAQLATRGKYITSLKPSDLLLTPGGYVDLINPAKIAAAKGLSEARESSTNTLYKFFTDHGSFAEPSHNWLYLGSDVATKLAAKRAFRELRLKKAMYPATDTAEGLLNAYDLLEQSVNTAIHRQYVIRYSEGLHPTDLAKVYGDPKEFSRANGIEQIRDKIRKEVAKGKTPSIDPIEIARDNHGNLYIKEGRDRLAAAIMEGIQAVPVKKTNFVGESIDFTGLAVGPSFRTDHLFYSSGDQAVSQLPDNAQKFLNTDYKLSNNAGQRIMLKGEEVPSPNTLLATVGKWLGATKNRFKDDRILSFIDSAVAKSEDPMSAGISVANMVENSKSYFDFAKGLETKFKTGVSNVVDLRVKPGVEAYFNGEIRQAAKNYLDDLAGVGVFTNKTIDDPRRIGLFSGTVEVFDPARNAYRLYNSEKTADELLKYAKDTFNQRVGVEDVVPYSKVIVAGSDQVLEKSILDLVEKPHPSIVESLSFNKKFEIAPEYIKELEQKGIYYDPKTIPGIEPILKKLTTRVKSETLTGGAKYVRPTYSFFFTSTGHMFLGTGKEHDNVTTFLRDIFGEGYVPPGEWGVLNDEGVHLFNLLGSNADILGKAEIASMEGRLKLISRRIQEGGLGGGTAITVRVPWQIDRWDEFFGKSKTLGELSKDSFKLKIPKELIGTPLDLVVDAPHFGIKIVRNRMSNEADQSLVDFIMDEGDELSRKEKLAGIDNSQIHNYFHRVLSPGGQQAIRVMRQSDEALARFNSNFAAFVGKPIKAKNLEPFMLKRFFSDYRTDDINGIIKLIREGKAGGLKREDIFAQMIDKIKSDKDYVAFDDIAGALDKSGAPIDTDFFYEDAVLSNMARTVESVRARVIKGMLDTMESHSLVVAVTKDQRKEISKVLAGQGPSLKKIEQLNAEELALTSKYKAIQEGVEPNLGDMQKIEGRLKELQEERGKLGVGLSDTSQEAIKKYGALVKHVDIDSDLAYIDGAVAKRLVKSGALKPEDLVGMWDNDIVRVPVTKVVSQLGEDEKLLFFTKESVPLLERYFGSQRRIGGVAKQLLDWYDGSLSVWKQLTLFPVPAYHVRNFFSSAFMSWLGGVDDLESFSTSAKMWNLMRKVKNGKMDLEEANRVLDGRVYGVQGSISYRDLWSEWVRNGGASSGLHYNEFSRFRDQDTLGKMARLAEDAGYRPSAEIPSSMLLDNKLMRGGRSLAGGVEDLYRFSAFYDTWKKTGSFEKAALKMKAIFYDYNNLNMFEKSVLRRLMPFYSWARNNIPRMLEAVYTEPSRMLRFAKFTSDVQNGALNGEQLDPNTLPDYVKNAYGLIVNKREDGTYVVKALDSYIPLYDIFKLMDSPSRFVRDGLTPFLKYPYEEMINKSLYSGSDIEHVPGEPAKSFTLNKLGFKKRGLSQSGNILKDIFGLVANEHAFTTFARLPNNVVGLVDQLLDTRTYQVEKPGVLGATLDMMFGRLYYIDPNKARQVNQMRYQELLNGYDKWINYAEKHGDPDTAEAIRKMKLRHVLEKVPGAK